MQRLDDPLEAMIDLHELSESRRRLEEARTEAQREAARERQHEIQALLARLRAVEGDFDAAQREFDALKAELDGESRIALVRYYLERGRAHARAEDRPATRAHVEDAWYLARELDRGDLEFEAALLAAWSGEYDEKQLWKKRMREALESSESARALAEWRKAQLTHLVATDDYAVTYCLALR